MSFRARLGGTGALWLAAGLGWCPVAVGGGAVERSPDPAWRTPGSQIAAAGHAPASAVWRFSPLALEIPGFSGAEDGRAGRGRSSGVVRRRDPEAGGLGGERAKVLLRSLTVPGWGQATLGRRTSATVFAVAESGVWASFVSFRIQEILRRQSYERTARLFAGIDLEGRDEEFRRVVGIYPSSEEYNRLVVMRDAANLYYDDPVRYREYIAMHRLQGQDSWAWDEEESFRRYREERKHTRRAALRANAALGLAIANRMLSMVHAARHAGPAPDAPRSWKIECAPAPGDPESIHLGVNVRF